jgi:hypothetical protein
MSLPSHPSQSKNLAIVRRSSKPLLNPWLQICRSQGCDQVASDTLMKGMIRKLILALRPSPRARVSNAGSGLHLAGPLRDHHDKRDDRPSSEPEQGRSDQLPSHWAFLLMPNTVFGSSEPSSDCTARKGSGATDGGSTGSRASRSALRGLRF